MKAHRIPMWLEKAARLPWAAIVVLALLLPWAPLPAYGQAQELAEIATQMERLVKSGKYREATVKGEQAIQIAAGLLGENNEILALLHQGVGECAQRAGDLKGARRHMEHALRVHRQLKGDDHEDTTLARMNLGLLALDEGNLKEARTTTAECLKRFRASLGENHINTLAAWEGLGRVQYRLGDLTAAQKSWEWALGISRKTQGENHTSTATLLTELGTLDSDLGNFESGRKRLETALAIQRNHLGPTHPDLAMTLGSLGQFAWNTGDFTAGRRYYEEAVRALAKSLGERHVSTAVARVQYARILANMGDFETSEAEFQKSLSVLVGPPMLDPGQAGLALFGYGELQGLRKDYAAALQAHQRGLELVRQQLGETNINLAMGYTGVGVAALGLGRRDEARVALNKAIEIRSNSLGADIHENAYAQFYLADCDYRDGSFEQAEAAFQVAQATFRRSQSAGHPLLMFSNFSRVACLGALERWSEAAALADETRRGMRRHAVRILPSLSEQEQLAFMSRFDDTPYHGSLTLGWLRKDDPELVELSCNWLLNGKAAGQEALAQRTMLSRDARDASLGPAIRALAEVRQVLARLTLAAIKPGSTKEREASLRSLSEQEASLARQCAQKSVTRSAEELWVTTDQVREVLPESSRLIEIMRLRPVKFGAPSEQEERLPPRYLAWVIPPKGQGPIVLIDLGDADSIDALVATVRTKIAEAPTADGKLRQEGEPAAWEELLEPLTALADRIWKPLVPHTTDAKTILLSPDGALWLAPWGALPISADEMLIERHAMQLLISGRMLTEKREKVAEATRPVLFANPQFELAPVQVQAAIKAVFKDENLNTVAQVSVPSRLPAVAQLPGTAAEAKAVIKNLQSYAGAEPILYEGPYALETIAKRLRRPRVAVLSTHGFFLGSQAEASDADSGLRSAVTTGLLGTNKADNPLAMCGLLLAGCNPRNSGEQGGPDDGVLTGLEILNMDLRGTELVVLSACETGIGQVNNGEGVAGLRQAFQLAGADYVISTLWQIPDLDSARLMNDFFANLAAGQTKADALRGAQLNRIAARRERNGAAHPFFWAAYTLTGK